MPKMSEYVKTIRVKEGNNKLMSFHIDDKKLLQKYIRLFGLSLKT